MFEKHRNNPPDNASRRPKAETISTAPPPAKSGRTAVIGPGIHITGDVKGDEDLLVEGRVDGNIKLDSNKLEIGQSGNVQADITARVIRVSGRVKGDINGSEKVVIANTGNIHGNITAPRMTLEDGAIFKGSIDMDPGDSRPVKQAKPASAKKPEPAKIVAGDKTNQDDGQALNGR